MFRPIAVLIFRLLGWKVLDNRPKDLVQAIYVVAPHTSNWDFPLGVLGRSIARLDNARYLGKKELFRPPLGWIMRALGGYPVDRGKSSHVVDQVVGYFRTIPDFAIGIAPEGTRKHVEKWKSGFWHIARKANVPLILTSFDYGRKEITFREPYWVGDDLEKDMAWIKDYFKAFRGRRPEHGVR